MWTRQAAATSASQSIPPPLPPPPSSLRVGMGTRYRSLPQSRGSARHADPAVEEVVSHSATAYGTAPLQIPHVGGKRPLLSMLPGSSSSTNPRFAAEPLPFADDAVVVEPLHVREEVELERLLERREALEALLVQKDVEVYRLEGEFLSVCHSVSGSLFKDGCGVTEASSSGPLGGASTASMLSTSFIGATTRRRGRVVSPAHSSTKHNSSKCNASVPEEMSGVPRHQAASHYAPLEVMNQYPSTTQQAASPPSTNPSAVVVEHSKNDAEVSGTSSAASPTASSSSYSWNRMQASVAYHTRLHSFTPVERFFSASSIGAVGRVEAYFAQLHQSAPPLLSEGVGSGRDSAFTTLSEVVPPPRKRSRATSDGVPTSVAPAGRLRGARGRGRRAANSGVLLNLTEENAWREFLQHQGGVAEEEADEVEGKVAASGAAPVGVPLDTAARSSGWAATNGSLMGRGGRTLTTTLPPSTSSLPAGAFLVGGRGPATGLNGAATARSEPVQPPPPLYPTNPVADGTTRVYAMMDRGSASGGAVTAQRRYRRSHPTADSVLSPLASSTATNRHEGSVGVTTRTYTKRKRS